MKIPTSPLVLLANLFGYSAGSLDDQTTFSDTPLIGRPEPAVSKLPSCDAPEIQAGIAKTSYDYIVVGAGAGGGPVAARLAQEGWNVLVVEGGKDHVNLNTTIPLYLIQATEDPVMSLNYLVNHYPKGTQYGDVKTWYPRSQGLGGSTIHNALINLIPHKWDFEQLQATFNDDSWSWENMAPYFTRIENNLYLDPSIGQPIGHGYAGWMSTQKPPLKCVLLPVLLPV
jgi:choline dehydrogenase